MNKKLISSLLGFALYATLANAAYIHQQDPSQYISGQQQQKRYVALPLIQKTSQMSPEQQAQLLEQQRLQQEELKKAGYLQTIGQERRVHEGFPEQEFDPELQKQQEQQETPEKPKEKKPKEEEPKEEKQKEEKPEKEKPKEKEKEEKPEKEKPKEKKEKEEKPKEEEKKKKEKKEPFKVLYKSDKFNLEKETPEKSLRSNLDSQTLTINKEPSKQTGESVQKMNEFIRNLTLLMQNFGLMSASPQMSQQMGQVMDPMTYEQYLLQQDMQPQMLIIRKQRQMKPDDESDESMSEEEE